MRAAAREPRTRARRALSCLGLVAAAVASGAAWAETPGHCPLASADGGAPWLRWENIEGGPYVVGGVRPSWWLRAGVHVFTLEPAERTRLWIPGAALVRLHAPGGRLDPARVDAWWSNGSGVRIRLDPAECQRPDTLFIDPRSEQAGVLEIRCPPHGERVELAAYLGRFLFGDCEGLCAHPLGMGCPAVSVERSGQCVLCSDPRGWRRCPSEGDGPFTATVEGPAHVVLTTLLVYAPEETSSRQWYEVRLRVDDDLRHVRHETSLDTGEPTWVDGERRLVGRERSTCFDLGGGTHEIEIDACPEVVWSLRKVSPEDYLLHPGPPCGRGDTGAPEGSSLGGEGPLPVSSATPVPLPPILGGSHRDSGLLLAFRALEVLRRVDSPPRARATADIVVGRNSQYRGLLPEGATALGEPLAAAFVAPRLRDPLDPVRDIRLPVQHLGPAIGGVSSAIFLRAPDSAERPFAYGLPTRRAPSSLRVVVARPCATAERLLVQIDESPPVPLELSDRRDLPLRSYLPTRAEAAVSGLSANLAEILGRGPALPEPFLRAGVDLPAVEVGVAELPLPQTARTVKVWAEGDGVPPRVALEYLAESAYSLTEREYLERVGRPEAAAPDGLIGEFLRWRSGPDPLIFQGEDLLVHRLPLYRFLGQALDQVEAQVPGGASGHPPAEPADRDLAPTIRRARDLESAGDAEAAFEAWTEVVRDGDPGERRTARFRRVDALLALGEGFLAERQLLGLWRSDPDPATREEALERLLELHAREGDADAAARVLAVEAVASRRPDRMRALAELLAADGKHSLALQLLLDLPEEERPAELLLRCAFREGWWETYRRTADRIADAGERARWRGLSLVARGAWAEGLEELRRADVRGTELAARIDRALEIGRRLSGPDPRARAAALLEWEAWHASAPGPWAWSDDPAAVVDRAGVAATRSVARNLTQEYSRATPLHPVRIRVLGPAAVRIGIRPVHPAPDGPPIDGWALIRGRGISDAVPITGNRPSRGVEIAGGSGEAAGTEVSRDLSLGPGLHEVELGAVDRDTLFRIEVRRPEISPGLLPAFSYGSLLGLLAFEPAAVSGAVSSAEDRFAQGVLSAAGFRAPERRHPIRVLRTPIPDAVDLPPGLPARLAARLALRMGSRAIVRRHLEDLRAIVGRPGDLTPAEVELAKSWVRELDPPAGSLPGSDARSRPAEAGAPGEPPDLESALGRAGLDEGDGDPVSEMERLVYAAERLPGAWSEAVRAGAALAREHPGDSDLQRLARRLLADTAWEKISLVQQGAGFRLVRPEGWQPELTGLRIRRGLLRRAAPGERAIVGTSPLRLVLRPDAPIAFTLLARLEAVEYLRPTACAVRCVLDGAEVGATRLSSPDERARIGVSVPAGEHVVQILVDDPVVDQVVWVATEGLGSEAIAPDASSEDAPEDLLFTRRRYEIAARDRPVRVGVEGPSSLRVDELRDGATITTYRELGPGVQELVLEAGPGRSEALYRIFRRVRSPGREPSRPWQPDEVVRPVPEPPWTIGPGRIPTAYLPDDVHPLGGQEDGTGVLRLSANRKAIFEEDDEGEGFDRYLELKASWLAWNLRRTVHSEASVLARTRLDGGPTLGLEETIHWRPDGFPATLRVEASGYMQWPEGGAVTPDGPSEWSASLSAGLARWCALGARGYHVPSASVFGRLLSLDGDDPLPDGVLDPDVFSDYKADHRYGVTLSESAGYRPWLDTEWWGRVSVTSNERFAPPVIDHVTCWAGWRQYFLGATADVGYRLGVFLADGDRESTYARHAVFANLSWEIWVSARDRIDLGLEYRHDFDVDRDVGLVSIAWYFSNGRLYRDSWPGAQRFEPLREAGLSRRPENRIRELYRDDVGGR